MKGLAEINRDNAAATRRARDESTASIRRLKSRLARLYFVDTHPRREALKRDINHAVSEWAKREARRTKP